MLSLAFLLSFTYKRYGFVSLSNFPTVNVILYLSNSVHLSIDQSIHLLNNLAIHWLIPMFLSATSTIHCSISVHHSVSLPGYSFCLAVVPIYLVRCLDKQTRDPKCKRKYFTFFQANSYDCKSLSWKEWRGQTWCYKCLAQKYNLLWWCYSGHAILM